MALVHSPFEAEALAEDARAAACIIHATKYAGVALNFIMAFENKNPRGKPPKRSVQLWRERESLPDTLENREYRKYLLEMILAVQKQELAVLKHNRAKNTEVRKYKKKEETTAASVNPGLRAFLSKQKEDLEKES